MFVYPIANSSLGTLLGHGATEAIFSNPNMLARCLAFESSLTEALATTGLISDISCQSILQVLQDFEPNLDKLCESTLNDGMPVPELVKAIRESLPSAHRSAFHLGATSQDLIDTALAMALTEFNLEVNSLTHDVEQALQETKRRFGSSEVRGRTRMQTALPIRFGDRCQTWHGQFHQHSQQLNFLGPTVQILQLGGPVGDRSAFGDQANQVAEIMAEKLSLTNPEGSWHSQRAHLTTYAAWLATLSGILGKIGQDLALMAQAGELHFENAGFSSAMPHKRNPIAAETLVTLARFNATLVSGMQHSVIHEQERSGAAWALEWMLLPQICVAAAASLVTTCRLLHSLQSIESRCGAPIHKGA